MTVQELRDRLAPLDGTLEVIAEGCDCSDSVVRVQLYSALPQSDHDSEDEAWKFPALDDDQPDAVLLRVTLP